MSVQILQGDCRDVLRTLPDESVHCVVTSPPYWGLRDYGVAGQLGMERSLGEHVETMAAVFSEVRRVLRADGTLWLNYGDSYAASINGRSAADTKAAGNDDRTFRDKPFSTIGPIYSADVHARKRGFLKPKDLCGIPWRVAFALQEDGWWLRQDIIWSKPNPMPESIKDRCTKAHEYLFLLAKSERYYFDSTAIAEASVNPESYAGHRPRNPDKFAKHDSEGKARTRAGFSKLDGEIYETKNKRSVWEITTQPYADAHFATFPPALIEPCILAGCPVSGTVLDPFGGAGTTGLVADRLGRNAILIELNPEYAAMAERRIKNDAPLFTDVGLQAAE